MSAAGTPTSHHPNIRVERDSYVATVTIDRPESKNACTGDMWVAIGAAFRELAYSGARVVLLTGANGNFCAGADLGGTRDRDTTDGNAPAPSGTMIDAMRVLSDVVLAVHDCPIPVVAKVDGVCVGAGLGLALAADLAWCSDRARFSAIFAKRGLSMDFGSSWLLRQRIGVHRAKELAFTAKMLSGAEACELGLVNAVVPEAELDDAARAIADTIAAGPPIALSMTKRELNNASSSSLAQALEAEALAQSVNVHTDDLREALTAWATRRPPNFTGR
ncbi:MAG: enoyl-CoA hydratase/isomerase family protein [Acidimicrobiia bacterium]